MANSAKVKAKARELTYDDYTVGIICPLEVEMTALRYMLDEEHIRLPRKDGDRNRYILGKLGDHNVAIGYLPQGSQGIGAAATVATDMRRTFSSVQQRLLVGIGGGIPSPKHDIRLGDVVVGMPDGIHGGVVQYDLGRRTVDGFQRKGVLCPPPDEWRTAVVEMKSDHEAKSNRIPEFLSRMLEAFPKLQKYSRPASDLDVLFPPDTKHVRDEPTCDKCDKSKAVRPRASTGPEIFYGTIASGDSVMMDAEVRNELGKVSGGALCFEMEAAGLTNGFPCLVIRGICDYADSHKNDQWQPYAAAVAAACAKELLTYMDPVPVPKPVRPTSYFLVPRQRVKNFFGREEQLDQITTYFKDDIERLRILVLQALGGQGKSQIALEYCQRARKQYRGVFWMNSGSKSTLTQALVSIAGEFDLTAVEALSDDNAKVAFTLRTLEQWEDRWLMVFDNCDDPAIFSDVERFFPQGGKGDILFTSRHRGLGELGHIIDVPPMPDKAGVELLLHRYPGIDVNEYLLEGAAIVNRLGGLALAIDQASAYMAYKQLPIDQLSDFLAQYEVRRKKVLQHTADHFWKYMNIGDENGRKKAVNAFTTWEMSFEQLLDSCDSPDSVAHFLIVAAFLGPIHVSETLFQFHRDLSEPPPDWCDIFLASGGSDDEGSSSDAEDDHYSQHYGTPGPSRAIYDAGMHRLQKTWDSARFWHLIRQAYQMSLVQSILPPKPPEGATLILHSLIRDWLQLRVGSKDRQSYTHEAVDIIVSSLRTFVDRDVDATIKRSILLHIDATLSTVKSFFREGHRLGQDITSCTNADWFAAFYRDQGRFNESLDLYRTVVATRVRVQGKEHPSTLKIMNNLALVLRDQGKYDDASQMYREVVEVHKRLRGKEHPDTLGMMNNLALVLGDQGKYHEAEQMYREVVEVLERVLGKENPFTLSTMSNLTTVLRSQAKYDEAEQMCREVVEVQERVRGKEHLDTMTTMDHLATVLWDQGKYDEASQMYREVVDARERVLGEEHPSTLSTMSNIATMARVQGKYVEAEQMYREVVDVQERVLGKEHPDTLSTLDHLATVLGDQAKYGEASQMFREVVEVRERVLGKEHPSVVASMNNLAIVLNGQGKYDEASHMHGEVVKLQERMRGKEHPDTLRSMNNLATVLSDQGKYGEAEQMYREVMEVRDRVLGKEHPDTLTSMNNLATLLNGQGNYDEALQMFEKVVKVLERVLGKDHPTTLTSMNNLAAVLRGQGKHKEAEQIHRKVLKVREKVLGKKHPSTLGGMNNLALVLRDQGKYHEAEQTYREVVEVQEGVLGKEHPELLTTMSNLATVLGDQGKYNEAEQMFREVVEVRERVLGKEHPDTLTSINNLALVLRGQGKYDDAEQMYRGVVDVQERVRGKEHLFTLTCMNNLALVLRDQGKYDEALQMFREVVGVRERMLGKEHPTALTAMSNLTTVLRYQGMYDEAEQMCREVMKVQERVLGKEHPSTLSTMNNLALVLRDQGKYDEASQRFREVVEVRERMLGKEHPITLSTMSDLAMVPRGQGKYDEAEQMCREVVKVQEMVLGKEHPDTLSTMNNLAMVLRDQGKNDEALQMFREVVEVRDKVLGKEHPSTLMSMNNLALVLSDQMKYK